MADLTQWNAEATIEQLSQSAYTRLDTHGFSPDALEENMHIVGQFSQIAANMITQEGIIEVAGSTKPIQHDPNTASQAMELFSEGIVHALIKCDELGIEGEPKSTILQNMAMEVYNQAKQVVGMTYGQDQTPDFQIAKPQQMAFMQQSADNHLLHFLKEYEAQSGGSLQPQALSDHNQLQPDSSFDEPTRTALPNPPPASQAEDDGWDLDDDDEENDGFEPPSPAAKPTAKTTKTPNTHDKYAAVALLLNTLPDRQKGQILKQFNAEEQALISHYSDPERIAKELDLASVEEHLKRFKQFLQEQGNHNPLLFSKTHQGIRHLVQASPQQSVLSCIEKERPRIKRFIEACYETSDSHKKKHLTDILPPKVEEALFQYLSQIYAKR